MPKTLKGWSPPSWQVPDTAYFVGEGDEPTDQPPGAQAEYYRLGCGGGGSVWLGSKNRRRLALKFVPAEGLELSEGEILYGQELRNEHIVGVLDVVDLWDHVAWRPAVKLVVMAHCGMPLSTLCRTLKQNGSYLPPMQLRRYAENLINALYYLHQKNLVHRDINPGNVLIETKKFNATAASLQGSIARLGDLGTVTEIGANSPLGLKQDVFHAKPPELFSADETQRRQWAAHPAQDAYAVGKLLEFCLNYVQVLDAQDEASLADLAHLKQRCLAADPAQRPQTTQLMLEVFENKVPEQHRSCRSKTARRTMQLAVFPTQLRQEPSQEMSDCQVFEHSPPPPYKCSTFRSQDCTTAAGNSSCNNSSPEDELHHQGHTNKAHHFQEQCVWETDDISFRCIHDEPASTPSGGSETRRPSDPTVANGGHKPVDRKDLQDTVQHGPQQPTGETVPAQSSPPQQTHDSDSGGQPSGTRVHAQQGVACRRGSVRNRPGGVHRARHARRVGLCLGAWKWLLGVPTLAVVAFLLVRVLGLGSAPESDSQKVAMLIKLLARPGEQLAASIRLVRDYGDQAAPQLARAVDHQNKAIRRRSLRLLQKLEGRAVPAVPGLFRVLRNPKHATYQEQQNVVLVLAGLRLQAQAKSAWQAHAQKSVPLLAQSIDTTNGPKTLLALQALAVSSTPEALDHLSKAVVSDDAALRFLAMRAVVQFCQRDCQPAGAWLVRGIDDPEPRVAMEAASGLGRFGQQAIQPLMQALNHRHPRVVAEAIKSLQRLGPRATPAVPQLIQRLKEGGSLSSVSADALQAIGLTSVEPLIGLLSNQQETVRIHTIQALSKIQPAPVTQLINALGSRYDLVRAGAADALGLMGAKAHRAIGPLKRLARRSDTRGDVHRSARYAFRNIEMAAAAASLASGG